MRNPLKAIETRLRNLLGRPALQAEEWLQDGHVVQRIYRVRRRVWSTPFVTGDRWEAMRALGLRPGRAGTVAGMVTRHPDDGRPPTPIMWTRDPDD